MTLNPISLKNRLAATPSQDPRFSVEVKTASGPLRVADPKATRALVALMDMNAVLGGAACHYGGPAAFAELMSATHGLVFQESKNKKTPWHELFHLVNDAGHCENGLYALKANYGFADLTFEKLKKFRSIDSVLTGHGESHLFPEGVLISNGPLGSALPQSQGLAMADKLAGKNRVTITAISDGGCMEGEAKEALAAIPGLAKAGKMAPFILIISDNNTKLTGRIDKESFSMNPTFDSLATLGWKVVKLADGHDLQKCTDVIAQAIEETKANPETPIAIHAKTIKGIGTKKTEESSSGGHGFPLKAPSELDAFLSEIYAGEAYPEDFRSWTAELFEDEKRIKAQSMKPSVPEEKIQTGISAAMSKAAKAGHPLVSITSDLPGSTGVAGFRKDYPGSSLDVGVAESNMMSTAAGFSKSGYIPVVDTFAQFGVTKGALPLTMASLSEAPMICVFSHTGFQDAADGASHQALAYVAMVSSIPHVDVYCLTCSEEAESLMTQTIEHFASERKAGRTPHSTVFFLGRENFPKSFAPVKYELGKAQVLHDSTANHKNSVAIIAAGSSVVQALKAAKSLEEKNVGVFVVNPAIINHPDIQVLKSAVHKSHGRIIMVEDHQMIGGMSQIASFAMIKEHLTFRLKALAVNGEFGQSAYNAIDLYKKHHIDAASIVKAAESLL